MKNHKTRKKRKAVQFHWGEQQQKSFDQLKDKLVLPPILAYADYKQPFKLHVDASTTGLGTKLSQTHEGEDRVMAYASRSLRNSERRYPAHKLEFLALKWAITEKFNDYLYGGNFDVYTDNNPLTYVLTTAKLDATGQKLLASFSNYNFKIFYKTGRTNIDAAHFLVCMMQPYFLKFFRQKTVTIQ